MPKTLFCLIFFSVSANLFASGILSEDDIKSVTRVNTMDEQQQQQLSITAGLLADYEILGKKLVANLDDDGIDSSQITHQAKELLSLSEHVIKSAQFRLPQCDEYLEKTLLVKTSLEEISHAVLEKDYHHDGALPKAPAECYHTKDLFIHAATVIVLTRDDPSLSRETKTSIHAEISEVLTHTEVVRQLVIY